MSTGINSNTKKEVKFYKEQDGGFWFGLLTGRYDGYKAEIRLHNGKLLYMYEDEFVTIFDKNDKGNTGTNAPSGAAGEESTGVKNVSFPRRFASIF